VSDAPEVAEAHNDFDAFDDLEADFEPEPLHVLVARRVARNEPRSQIATALGLTVDEVADLVGVAIEQRRKDYGTVSEQLYALHVQLDDIVDATYRTLDRDVAAHAAALLRIQVDAARLRADLLAREVTS
jgi:pyruvoyl-dependent arginine decarboxylase (PvlArgDC)